MGWQGACRLCPGLAARSRVSSGRCPRLAHCCGTGGNWGEQHPAELSPQGLLAEKEGRRDRRLTHGTGGDIHTRYRWQIAGTFLSTCWKSGCGTCRYCRASLPHGYLSDGGHRVFLVPSGDPQRCLAPRRAQQGQPTSWWDDISSSSLSAVHPNATWVSTALQVPRHKT